MADKLLGYVLPCFLGAILTLLGWISNSLYDISKSLAVVVFQIQNHEQRLITLEIWQRERSIALPTPSYEKRK